MSSFSAGEVIKQLRESKNLTQDQVCFGLCDKGTLSRIEKGTSMPSSFMLESLFERLGLEANKYFFSVSSKKDTELRNLLDKIEGLIINNLLIEAEQSLKELEELDEIETQRSHSAKDKGKQKIIKQTLLRNKAAIMQKKKEDPNIILELVQQALNLTIPGYTDDNIPNYLLTYREISLFNMLATAYKRTGMPDKAAQVLYDIKESMDNYYTDEYEKSRGYVQTLFSLSNFLIDQEKYTLAINICDIGIRYSIRNARLLRLPKLEYNKAYSMFKLGMDESEYGHKIIEAYYSLKLFGDEKTAQTIKNIVKAEKVMNWKE